METHRSGRQSGWWVAWLAFAFGICLSLVANICSVPALSLLQVTLAACPPPVPLLAVELLNGALRQRSRETGSETAIADSEIRGRSRETEGNDETARPADLAAVLRSGMESPE